MIAKLLRKLGPGLNTLARAVDHARLIEGEPNTAFVPESTAELLNESWSAIEALPVGLPNVLKFIKRLKNWLEEGRALLDIARRMQPSGALGDADQGEVGAIARYLVTVNTNEGRPITKQIAALLEVANGEDVPGDDTDARAVAWAKRLDKWKKALARASESAPPHRAPVRRSGGRKLGGDKRPRKPASVPRK